MSAAAPAMNARCGASRRPPREREHDERRDGNDAEIEVELRDVPEQPLRDGADRVAVPPVRLVRAEQRQRRPAARRLDDERERREPRPWRRRACGSVRAAQPEQQRRREHRREQRERLLARLVRERAEREQRRAGSHASAARASARARARRRGRPDRTRSRSSASPCRAATGSRPRAPPPRARTAGSSTRRARKYAGTAASDMTTELIAFAAAYASGTESNSRYAGLISSG